MQTQDSTVEAGVLLTTRGAKLADKELMQLLRPIPLPYLNLIT